MIGVIGGTILLEQPALEGARPQVRQTPHGTADLDVGRLGGVEVALVQRHGRRRDRPPHRVNHAANLSALGALGARRVLALGSTGCLRPELPLPALMIPHDYINFFDTTVFDDRLTHVTPGFDPQLRALLIDQARRHGGGLPVHDRGVYFQLRGPRLDTRAEVAFMRQFADCVGMTIGSEATVARELGLGYAALCTLDNHAHGLRPEIEDGQVDQAAIQASATANARACLAVLAAAVGELGGA